MIYTITIDNNVEKISSLNTVTSIQDKLDFGTLVIPFSTRPTRYEPETEIELNIDGVIETWLIESDQVTPIEKDNTTHYKHNITIIELTHKLDKYTLPSRFFVQKSNGNKFQLLDVVNNLIDTVPFRESTNIDSGKLIDFVSSKLMGKLEVISPDIKLTGVKTLLEAFAEIFKPVNAYPRLVKENGYYWLKADYYNELITLVDKDQNVIGISEQQNVNNYANTFDIYAANQVYSADKVAASIVTPSPSGWLGIRSDEGFLRTDNGYIPLEPIAEIIQVETYFNNKTYDITDYVLEETVRRGKETENLDLDSNNIIKTYTGIYQANTISYKIGGDRIENLYELFMQDYSIPAINSLIDSVVYRDDGITPANTTAPPPKDLKFRVRYISKISAREQVVKLDTSEFNNNSTLIVGQNDSDLASDKVLDSLFSRINRTGNTDVVTTQFNKQPSELYQLGTYTADNYVLTDIERIYLPNHVNVKYQWTKNFNKVSEFLGLNAEFKLYEVGSTEERNEVYKEYCILDTVAQVNNSYFQDFGTYVFMNTLAHTPSITFDKPIYAIAYQSLDVSGLVNFGKAIYRPVTSYAGGNSLVFHYNFKHPFSAGSELVDDGTKIKQRSILYTDEFYEVQDFKVIYTNDFSFDQNQFPMIDNPTSNYHIETDTLHLQKGQSEILAMTYQLFVLPSQNRVNQFIVGDTFLKSNNLISLRNGVYDNLSIYTTDENYNINENIKAKGFKLSSDYSINVNSRYLELNTPIGDETTPKNWAIGNDDGDLYLAVNQIKNDGSFENINRIYFNFRKERY